ncbi:hypothetical protein L6164_036091 [Bauhinia variegata]|uniref:Uncharacterized protein n=1 Tax=Bauhinia variegata TaxID=167791 RepID=A0ACB9KG26_BAUVA|nr:hypothetical protein L6164_036091 [Bauhinia variegata]
MGFFWFLVFSALVLLPSAFVESEVHGNPTLWINGSIQLSLYHVQSLDSSLTSTSTSTLTLSDMLAKDEERVRAIQSRLENNVDKSSEGTSVFPKALGGARPTKVPVKSGLPIGTLNYFVKIGLGTPPKYFSLVIDSGSSLNWLQCQPCKVSCHQQVDPLFDPSASKTYKRFSCSSPQCSSVKGATLNDPLCETSSNTCVYRATYGDRSISEGYLSQDVLTLNPSETLANFIYGCGQNNVGLFGRSAGFLGLANNELSLLAQLSTKYGNAFSYCLPTSFSSNPANSGKFLGFLSIGSSLLATSSYKFTPTLKNPANPDLYFLDLTALTVAGKPLGVAASSYKMPTIIDSGTVITRLPPSVYAALKGAFVNILSKRYKQVPAISLFDACFAGNVKNALGVPEIQLIFGGGADLTLRAPNTLLYLEEDGATCLAFAATSGNIAIIGNYQQQTFTVAYDVSNSKIGFAAGGCQ